MPTKPVTSTSSPKRITTRRADPRRSTRTVAAKLVVAPRATTSPYAAFDGLTNAIMVADHTGVITYLNRAATALFTGHGEQFRRAFPGFDAANLVGQTIDRFHRN